MKRKMKNAILLMCIMLLCGCSMGNTAKENSQEDFDEYAYYVASEEGIKKDNTVLYRIEYEYDEDGNEISRKAFDAEGREDKDLLSYAYDQQEILEEYWTVAPREETVTGYWRTYKDYDFTYDARGNLTTWNIYDDNEAELAKIEYTYKAVPVSEE